MSPLQSSRICSNFSYTIGGSVTSTDSELQIHCVDNDDPGHNRTSALDKGGPKCSNYFSIGISNRVQISLNLLPGLPWVYFQASAGVKANVFDFPGKGKLFRNIAFSLYGSADVGMKEWESWTTALGGGIIGTYQKFNESELELVFIPLGEYMGLSDKLATDTDQYFYFYNAKLGLGAIYWPTSNKRVSLSFGGFYRIPVTERVLFDQEFYTLSYTNNLSPWYLKASIRFNLAMP